MNDDYTYGEMNEDEYENEGFDHSGVESGEDDDSQDYEDSDLSIGFIRLVGKECGGVNVYEFIFTNNKDEFWGKNFEYFPASICNGVEPDSQYIQKVVKIRTMIDLCLIQDCGCFSMQDCMDGIIALAWQDLSHMDAYPEDGRLYFMFGESYDDVERKLALKHILIGF